MKTNLIITILAAVALVGCARFSTTQKDLNYGKDGKPERLITTRASGLTFFSGSSSLATWKASQTDKTQTATVGNLALQGGQTNQVSDIISAVASGAVQGAVKAAGAQGASVPAQ